MPHPAVRVRNLGKEYTLGKKERGYTTFREAISNTLTAPFRRFRHLSGQSTESFWALKDVSFDIQEGEVVGIIGRNGAGKSTLLKILSQITEPTKGNVELCGRVGSLLEVGTGFHPELSGRENIYLNGAILGMKRQEIDRKFDEIVAFSEVEKFLDTPVKRYSSGMQTRLAFSVAAHLEPELMIVDEVLAVGDAAFQEKCLGKMNEVSRSGRTILFVSHNMAAVESLCSRGIVLESGSPVFDGDPLEAVREYFRAVGMYAKQGEFVAQQRGTCPIQIIHAKVTANGQECQGRVPIGSPIEFHITCSLSEDMIAPDVGIGVQNSKNLRIVSFHTKCDTTYRSPQMAKTATFCCRVPNLNLVPGKYSVSLGLDQGGEILDLIDNALVFSVLPSDFFRNSGKRVGGVVFFEHTWTAHSA